MKLKKSLPILVFAASAIVAAKAYALSYSNVYTYYSDASYSTEVGTRSRSCSGEFYYSGTVTPYRLLTEREPCCGSYTC